MGDIFDFFRYMLKDGSSEITEFLKDIISLRPKTMVYLTGTLFVLAWLLDYKIISLSLMFVFIGFLFYKYYVAGDWRRYAKEEKLKTQNVEKDKIR